MGSRSRRIDELTIRNIGVIEQASLSLGPGFNVITGETGAGKTMVLTGLNLIAGARSDAELIRRGSDRLSVTTLFSFTDEISGELKDLITEYSPEVEENALMLQRSVSIDGRSKAIIGSDPSTVSLLERFAREFFVIHGQSTNHKLVDEVYQLELLDRAGAECREALLLYREALDQFNQKNNDLEALRDALKDREREIANAKRFIQEMERTQPIPGEWLECESRILRLDSVEEIREAVTTSLALLTDDSQGVVTMLHQAMRSLDHIQLKASTFESYSALLRSAQIDINEVVTDLQQELAAVDAEPGELNRLRERKTTLRQFLQRNRDEVPGGLADMDALDALIDLLPRKKALLDDLEQSDLRLAEIESVVELERLNLQTWSERLTKARASAAEVLSKAVNEELRRLGLLRATFSVAFLSSKETHFTRNGVDHIQFLFAAHDGDKGLPLNKGASGGELSRVMLAIELALAEHREIGTIIFDEIDAGIGGETGLIIGERIAQLANHFQIIVITHLAQVAVWADRHYRIEKNDNEEIVLSSVTEVSGEERVVEIARMLSGQSDSAVALEHAQELLEHAQKS